MTIAVILCLTILVGIFTTHMLHVLLLSQCTNRTDTRSTTIFNLEQRPDKPVVFDFSRRDPHSVDVTIPAGSKWRNLPTFHRLPSSCMTLHTLGGWTDLFFRDVFMNSGSIRDSKGSDWPQRPYEMLTWNISVHVTGRYSSSVRLFTDAQLWRTECSVIQDSERYFSLCTTPLWLRTLYWIARMIPGNVGGSIRRTMVDAALYVQLRAIYYNNDCWTYQGCIRIDWYWWLQTPKWVWEFQGRTAIVISQVILGACYWIGRLVLGMRASYEEYEVQVEAQAQAQAEEEVAEINQKGVRGTRYV